MQVPNQAPAQTATLLPSSQLLQASALSSDCELVDAETSSTMSMGSGSDCDAPITEDSSESEEEVSSSDSEKDVHSSEDEYELGTPDDAGPSGSQAVDEGPSYDTDE